MSAIKRAKPIDPDSDDSGILNELVLIFIFNSINWDLQTLCLMASVNRKLRAIAKRILWRELCVNRAPRMLTTLTTGLSNGSFPGGWHALAKLMFFCCGCESTTNFRIDQPSPGHFTTASRFSKTSGRSFLTKRCRGDLLFVSDPCEHPMGDNEDDLGIYRGVFQGFKGSKTRACLIRRQVKLEESVKCPYCGARVWSMTTARLVPKSAVRRLGSHDGGLEFFVCVNGHLHGSCWLVPLSSDEDKSKENEADDDDDYGDDSDDFDSRTVGSGSTSSVGEEIVAHGLTD